MAVKVKVITKAIRAITERAVMTTITRGREDLTIRISRETNTKVVLATTTSPSTLKNNLMNLTEL